MASGSSRQNLTKRKVLAEHNKSEGDLIFYGAKKSFVFQGTVCCLSGINHTRVRSDSQRMSSCPTDAGGKRGAIKK
jgi:hypothetical protein